SGSLLDSDVTDANGLYNVFERFPYSSGHYLQFEVPEGYLFTLQDQGSNDVVDSDVDPSTGRTAEFGRDGSSADYDAGLVPVEVSAALDTTPDDLVAIEA